jgi:sugar lactone lactonase YvrE
MYYPTAVVADGAGDLYIADNNQRIRMVNTNGIITTVAGNGVAGFAGDGGAATNASLNSPVSVALDASGNVYVADQYNQRIRKVLLYASYPALRLNGVGAADVGSYTAVVTSPYGSVTSAVAALAVLLPPSIVVQPASHGALNGSNATLNVTAMGTQPLYYFWYFGATNLVQSGTNSTLTVPNFSTNNAGNYTVVITNIYGSVTSQVAALTVVFPPVVTVQPGSMTVLAGSNATLSVAVAGSGPFSYVWQLNGTNIPNNIITTAAGKGSLGYTGDGGAATNAFMHYPFGAVVDSSGNLYIADTYNQRIREVGTSGIITTVAGNGGAGYSGDGGAATNASLYYPRGVAVDASGNVYIADYYNNGIRKVGTNGIITTVAGNGTAGYSGDGGAATNASLHYPFGVAVDAAGSVYIADAANQRIRKVGGGGIITTVAGKGTVGFSGDGGAATNASLYYPSGMALDAAGNLYIADYYNNRIRRVDTNGIITTVAGNGSASYAGDGGAATNAGLNLPYGVAVDSFGNLYVADTYNERIREVHFAGSPSFTINNAGTNNAGNYTVVITSPYASVTSAAATLGVALAPPQIITSDGYFGFGFLAGQFGFSVSAAAGQTVVLDGTTDLVDWTPLLTNTLTGNLFYFYDPAWSNSPWRFYRARLP